MIQHKILPELKLIIIKYSGEVRASDIHGALTEIIDEVQDRRGYHTLSTATEAKISLSSEDIIQLLSWLSTKGAQGDKTAMVVGDSHGFGLHRMWASHAETRIPHENQIFNSVADACAWLDVPFDEVEQILAEMS